MLRYLLVSLILIVLSCKEQSVRSKINANPKNEIQSPDYEDAIQKILDVPDFQKWLHGEVPERMPLKLLMNEFIKKEYDLQKFGKQVRIVDSTDVKLEQIQDAIRIRLLETEKDTIRFSLYHHIEGAIMQGRLYLRNDRWNIIVEGIEEI